MGPGSAFRLPGGGETFTSVVTMLNGITGGITLNHGTGITTAGASATGITIGIDATSTIQVAGITSTNATFTGLTATTIRSTNATITNATVAGLTFSGDSTHQTSAIRTEAYTGQIETASDKTYTIDPKVATARTITGFYIKSGSGTVTATLKNGSDTIKAASVSTSSGDQSSLGKYLVWLLTQLSLW